MPTRFGQRTTVANGKVWSRTIKCKASRQGVGSNETDVESNNRG